MSRHPSAIRPILLIAALLAVSPLFAEPTRDPEGLETTENLGGQLPLDTVLTDENGKAVRLGDFFGTAQKPVILIPSYFTCPRLCTFIFRGVQKAAAATKATRGLIPGRDYTIVSISFKPEEGPADAARKGREMRGSFDPPLKPEAWQFLTGDPASIAAVMDAIGYQYRPDGEEDYSHAAVIVMAGPEGKITRYLYGVTFEEATFRLSLIESSYGQIGNTAEKIFLYCFRFDPQEGKYTPYMWAIMRIGGVLTVIFIVGLIFFVRRGEKAEKA